MRLDSIHIKNYKLFKDLEIPKLGQVNLITGKNNTGKTILLEALRIWASEGDASVVNNIIWKRGDWNEGANFESYSSLFSNREVAWRKENYILINNLLLFLQDFDLNRKYVETFDVYKLKRRDKKLEGLGRIIRDIGESGEVENEEIIDSIFDYYEEKRISEITSKKVNKEYPQDVAIFVPASIDFDNKKLWANIDLTDKKDIVIQILQIIEPSIMDLGIIDNVARVRTQHSKTPVPLKNFGEGLNRLLTIAMALVSADDNLLLIDEIDTGLHYSVLEKLWEILFKYAGELNVQVFVTTHSGDCVNAFTAIANKKEFEGMGNYFRLQWTRDHQKIVPIFYDENELEIAVDQNIETR